MGVRETRDVIGIDNRSPPGVGGGVGWMGGGGWREAGPCWE